MYLSVRGTEADQRCESAEPHHPLESLMPTTKHPPLRGDVVILTFKGLPTAALGVWSGTSWFMWRQTNAGMTGEPNNWHIVETELIRAWSEIPPGVLATLCAIPSNCGNRGGSEPLPLKLVVRNTTEPWRPAMEDCPMTRKFLRTCDRAHKVLTKPARKRQPRIPPW
jgi:hypothetical protein